MDYSFEGKKAIVTGVGAGIGRSIARALALNGATVHGLSRTQADLESLQKEVPSIHTYCVDVTDWNKTRETVQSIGPVDILVNNAGIFKKKKFLETSKEELLEIFAMNTESVFNISQVAARGMVESGTGGVIVTLSSITATCPRMGSTACSMSKAASEMLTKCMALELGKHKIRVNSVNPTIVKTPRNLEHIRKQPEILNEFESRSCLRPPAEVEDVVNAVLFLLSDKANMITGTCLPVDGGFTIG